MDPVPTAPRSAGCPPAVGRACPWLLAAALLAGCSGDDGAATPTTPRRTAQTVRTRPVVRRQLVSWVFAQGNARAVRREFLTFEIAGRVTEVAPQREGDAVTAGQTLARLDERQSQADVAAAEAAVAEAQTREDAAEAEVEQARTQLTLTQRQLQREKELVQRRASAQESLDEAQATRDNAAASLKAAQARVQAAVASIAASRAKVGQAKLALEDTTLVSPIDGVVAYLNLEPGYYFTPSMVRTTSEADALQTVPMVVIDPSQFEVVVDVPAYEAGRIGVGQRALLLPGGSTDTDLLRTVSTGDGSAGSAADTRDADWHVWAEVYAVNPAINPGGRSIRIKLRTTGGAPQLKDGMFVTAWIAANANEQAVVVPFDALVYEDNRPAVFVVEDGIARRRAVSLGIQGLDGREATSGVAAGEQVVTDGRYRLTDGAAVAPLDDQATAVEVAQ